LKFEAQYFSILTITFTMQSHCASQVNIFVLKFVSFDKQRREISFFAEVWT